jgi:pyruvate/2-oxoglutarate dehydrogenase complex dihydrolipoamide dehydrogenase (E3) component
MKVRIHRLFPITVLFWNGSRSRGVNTCSSFSKDYIFAVNDDWTIYLKRIDPMELVFVISYNFKTSHMLTPVATYEGEIVAANMLGGNHIIPNYNGIPSVVFTIPPLASVGLQEEVARKQGLRFKTNKADTSSWYSSRRVGENYSGYKVLIEEDTERVLGAHILGSHAEEVINIFAIAIRLGIKAGDIKHAIFSYPTNTSDVRYML